MIQTTQSERQKNILVDATLQTKDEKDFQKDLYIDRAVIKDFFIYSLGSILLKGSNYALVPLIAFRLTVQEFGLLSLINNFITITAIILGFGLRQVVSIEFFHHDSLGQKKLINEVITLYIILSVPLLLLALIFFAPIKQLLFESQISTFIFVTSLLTCFITFFNELFLQVLRYKARSMLLTKIQLHATLISTILKIFFLYVCSLTIAGIIVGNFLGLSVIGCYGIYYYRKKVSFLKNDILSQKAKVANYLKCGLPFIPSVLFSWILASSDRWILAQYTNLHNVGLYSFVDTFSQIFQLFILYPLIGAYFPYIIKQFVAHPHNSWIIESKNRKIMWIIMGCSAFSIALLYIIGRPVLLFLTPTKYHESLRYIVPLLLGQVLLMGTNFLNCYLQYLKKIYYIVGLIGIPAILNILLNFALVPSLKVSGCVVATLVSYLCYFILTWFASSRIFRALLLKSS